MRVLVKIHISSNFILSISLLIMFDTLLLRPSLHCNTPLHFTTLHPTTLHNTYRHITSSHLPFTALSFSFTHLHFLSFYTSHHFTSLHVTSHHITSLHITSHHIPSLDTVQISSSKLFPPKKAVTVNKLNKQPRTADEGWSSSLGVGRGANKPSP
jgi:hypothetical protein